MTSLIAFTGAAFVGAAFVGRAFETDPGPIPASVPTQLRVPRVPIRLTRREDPSLTGQSRRQGGQAARSGADQFGGAGPQKIDPRSVRFTETLMTIMNGLLRNASLIQTGQDGWSIPVFPRQCADADAFNGEEFWSTDDLVLKYKTPGGTIQTITVT